MYPEPRTHSATKLPVSIRRASGCVYNCGVKAAGKSDCAAGQVPRVRVLLIAVAVASLAVGLATRTFESIPSHAATGQRQCSQVITQHMDCDASQWIATVANFAVLELATYRPQIIHAVRSAPRFLFENSLFNRPPPFLSSQSPRRDHPGLGL